MTGAAALPPAGLAEFDPRHSRLVEVPGVGADAGATRAWHVVDTGPALVELGTAPVGTILAVHGNPTWSYLWRRLVAESLADAAAGRPAWRVVAVDQLEMGFSERTDAARRLAQRVADLGALTAELGVAGGVVTLGHDWGGVVSLGWAVDHPELLAGVVLLDTAVHHPAMVPIPAPLRLARARGMLAASTVATPAFLDTTLSLADLDAAVKDAFRAPYSTAARRRGIGGFVADIPVTPDHASRAELDRIASGVAALEVPALLLWGPRDPIFGDRYLDDLVDRMPHADVHRFEGAGHLVAEERPYARAVLDWLDDRRDGLGGDPPRFVSLRSLDDRGEAHFRSLSEERSDETRRGGHEGGGFEGGSRRFVSLRSLNDRASSDRENVDAAASGFRPLWAGLYDRRDDDTVAVVDMATGGTPRRVTWRRLADRVDRLAAGLHALGIRPGDRVSLLVPPGPTLTAAIYACLRIGAVIVVADAGLGLRGLTRAVRGAWPDAVIGAVPGLAAARALDWPGIRISAEKLSRPLAAALGVEHSLGDLLGDPAGLPPEPSPDDPAAILYTSGSTGPSKGVAYTHRQLAAVRDVLAGHFGVGRATGLVTGFAPFALLGPALGTPSVTPDMDVSAPRTLTAAAVAAAVRASDARMVFLSPAAVANVVATADGLTADDRKALDTVDTFLSTGAPVSPALLTAAQRLMPNATAHTPYGMTECLLVADITLAGIDDALAASDRGVCVGRPIDGVRVLISPIDADGRATGAPGDERGVLGEIVISAPHLKDHYDRLWLTDRAAVRDTPPGRWHRTGDVGHLDADGRLWVEGRLPHVLVTAEGPVAPVGGEQEAETVAGVARAAVVGVGPRGLQQPVVVVETTPPSRRPGLADPAVAAMVRVAVHPTPVAVLAVPRLPTDIRHNSKIDRTRVAAWADRVLAGERASL